MSAEICNGSSPWKSTIEVTRAALALDRKGIKIAGMSDNEVLEMYRDLSDRQMSEPAVVRKLRETGFKFGTVNVDRNSMKPKDRNTI